MSSRIKESRKSWTLKEDSTLIEILKNSPNQSWNLIAEELDQRLGHESHKRGSAACRERYNNILNPELNKSKWTLEEEDRLFALHKEYGNSWCKIASFLPGRSDLICKNYFYATLRKVLRRLTKAVGKDQISDSLNLVKPCVLTLFYGEQKYKGLEVNIVIQSKFQSLIGKFRVINKIVSLDETEIANIHYIIENLIESNQRYMKLKSENSILQSSESYLEDALIIKKIKDSQTLFKILRKKEKQQEEISQTPLLNETNPVQPNIYYGAYQYYPIYLAWNQPFYNSSYPYILYQA
ncbi:hypothetical protein pb186bvf_010280 [Paramecium bursaria]